jgi:hypothetical protein
MRQIIPQIRAGKFDSYFDFDAPFWTGLSSLRFGFSLLLSFLPMSLTNAASLMREVCTCARRYQNRTGTPPHYGEGLRPFDSGAYPHVRTNRIEAAIGAVSNSKGN